MTSNKNKTLTPTRIQTHSKLASYKDSHLTPKQKTKQEQLTLTKYQKT